jgi:hypothetical protein
LCLQTLLAPRCRPASAGARSSARLFKIFETFSINIPVQTETGYKKGEKIIRTKHGFSCSVSLIQTNLPPMENLVLPRFPVSVQFPSVGHYRWWLVMTYKKCNDVLIALHFMNNHRGWFYAQKDKVIQQYRSIIVYDFQL